MEKKIEKFRDGIFELNTRRFGRVAELMIKELYNFEDSGKKSYDLKAMDGKRVEVKFSRVQKKSEYRITPNNLISSVIASKAENRILSFDEINKFEFDCNIQQIKTDDFDYLYYGCFFKDKIMICKIDSSNIKPEAKSDSKNKQKSSINYSDHQHGKYIGEGQFHINNSTIKIHLDKYLVEWLTYEELYKMFS